MKQFKSQTYGICTLDEMMGHIAAKMESDPKAGYLLAIGTDSQNHKHKTRYANIVMLHVLGRGGIFFYHIHDSERLGVVPHRMLEEAHQSIDIAKEILGWFDKTFDNGTFDLTSHNISLEIHCDIGPNGPSSQVINNALGWIESEFGETVTGVIKPVSAAASFLADRYVR